MARANTCILDKKLIDVAKALDLRDAARRCHANTPDFRCCQCNKPVCSHKASRYGAAHFEHRIRNPMLYPIELPGL